MDIEGPALQLVQSLHQQIQARTYQASNELRNAGLQVLRGQRSGKRYRVPFTRGNYLRDRSQGVRQHAVTYQASAPGEAPANRTGALRLSFWPRPRVEMQGNQQVVYPAVFSPLKYAWYLDQGAPNANILPRPFSNRIKAMALPKIAQVYAKPYNNGGGPGVTP